MPPKTVSKPVPAVFKEWRDHLAKVRKAHPNMPYADARTLASKTFPRKAGGASAKKAAPKKKKAAPKKK